MKAPVLERFDAKQTKKSFAGKVQASTEQRKKVVKQTFSISTADADHIQSIALKMGIEEGKTVSASKALRSIIDFHRAQK